MENEVSEAVPTTGGRDLPFFPSHRNAAYNQTPVKDPSGPAIAALILGVCGVSLVAIAYGVRVLDRVRKGGSNKPGRDQAFAVAGIVLGVLWSIVTVAVLVSK